MKNKQKLYQLLPVKIKANDEQKYTLSATFSTPDEDRHGDVVKQNWDLKNFKKNPVIVNSHNYFDATEVIGKATRMEIVDGKLEGDIEFAVEASEKAATIYKLYAGGFLHAFSVGFIAKEFDDKGTILKSELLEVSAVSVPANAYALAKAKGINMDALFGVPEQKKIEKSEACRLDGESKDECVARKLKEVMAEDPEMDQDQAVAIANSICDKACEKEETEEDKAKKAEDERLRIEAEEKEKAENQIKADEQKRLAEIEAKKAQARETLLKIAKVIDSFSDNIKAETSLLGCVATEKRAINRAVRKLINLKSI